MHVCILAGGRGTRMEHLTAALPKPLIPVAGVPILFHTLRALPATVTDVVLVIGYEGEKIMHAVGTVFEGRRVSYVTLDKLLGTAYGVFRAKDALPADEPFGVLNGDDLYHPRDLAELFSHPLALGIKTLDRPAARYLHVALREDGTISGLVRQTEKQTAVNVATGAYVLDRRIFDYEPVRIGNGELGLPHTVALMARDVSVRGVFMEHWFPLTSPEDVKRAEEHLRAVPFS